MLDMILAGGWVMFPLLVSSIVALAIIIERSWSLRTSKIIPQGLTNSILHDIKQKSLTASKLAAIEQSSPLGELLASIIKNIKHDREHIIQQVTDIGKGIVYKLEKNLTLLGTLATIAPLLGLFGTVVGIIEVFSAINIHGGGDASNLAGGISVALVTTATGLSVAIPSFIFYRVFERKIDELSYLLETESLKFLEALLKLNRALVQAGVASPAHPVKMTETDDKARAELLAD